jgi:putative flippase GtrA
MYVTKGVLQRYVCFLGVRMFLLGIWVPPSYAQITSQITSQITNFFTYSYVYFVPAYDFINFHVEACCEQLDSL